MASRKTKTDEIVDLLVKDGILTSKELLALHQTFHNSKADNFIDFLLEEGLVDTEDVLKVLSQYYQVESFDVNGYFFDRHLLNMFPKGFLLRNAVIPFSNEDKPILIMIAADPDEQDLAKIGEYVSYDIQFFVGIRLDIEDAIKEFYEKSVTQVPSDDDRNDRQRIRKQEKKLEYIDENEDVLENEEENY
jgi:type IV pilus assembly protein PilB